MNVSGFAARELGAVMVGTKITRSLEKFVVQFTKLGFKNLRGRCLLKEVRHSHRNGKRRMIIRNVVKRVTEEAGDDVAATLLTD